MHIVIIGNGIAGITTARHVRKLSDHDITVISAESEYFWSRPALMYVYMGHMKFEHTQPYESFFWTKNRINLKQGYVQSIDANAHQLQLAGGETISYDKLVLATGSLPNKFGWPGQDLDGVQGMVSKQDLDSMEARTPDIKHAVVVGGGLIGIEMAEMFHSRHIPVTFLVREKSFWRGVMPPEESELINQEIYAHPDIDLRLGTELKEILPDSSGKVRAVVTSTDEEIPCEFVGLTAGVHANTALADAAGIETGRGFLVDELLQTNVADIYAIGDCAELRNPAPGRRGIEAVWYTGKHMGPILAQTLCGTPTKYIQPTWFNSAKFLELEYQVYGSVGNGVKDGETHLYWQHPHQRKSIRIVYDTESRSVLGFNLMGIRYRQSVCQAWIESATHIEEVLQNLGAANFDPEFFKQYEADVVAQYNAQHPGQNLTLKRKRGWKQALAILAGK
ncbi:FAD-dependent oxidoreductase [Pontibacter sp. G13]|uniref:NAD(P)/FAD-dependent oxidoreductase n=1 Tax=Pontibacter sp. G13 TaxID=3074898 RepID=UPI00288C2D19|nr:FAD-dependent oxidoreductase [Pontibacter sp. G13]WNJ21426.1 FAD-dependent oxidoreductase [Pontibacter sp. G13]